MNKNQQMLKSFTDYCKTHPEQRFFQALRNWVQMNIDADCNFIYFAPSECLEWMMEEQDEKVVNSLKDTFYIEDDELGPTRD